MNNLPKNIDEVRREAEAAEVACRDWMKSFASNDRLRLLGYLGYENEHFARLAAEMVATQELLRRMECQS